MVIERNFDPEVYYDLLNFINYLIVLPKQLQIEYENHSAEKTKKESSMMKLKPAPGMKSQADAIYYGAYGVDIAAERTATKRQIQVAKHKAKLAEAKAKNAEAKAKETEAKAKETEAKAKLEANTKVVLALQFDRTVEQLAELLGISVDEINGILAKQTSAN